MTGLDQFKRKYRFRGSGSGAEQKRFWILLLIGLAVVAAIVYWG